MGKYLSKGMTWEDDTGATWTPEEFAQKQEWEGDMLTYGGPGVFPPGVREAAQVLNDFYEELEDYLEEL